jgi:amino acid transporter
MIWATHGFAVDTQQLTLRDATPSNALAGVVLVVFAFSGFESSTALGHEAVDPHKTIPRSVIQSVMIAGAFFMVMAFIVVQGFAQNPALGNLGDSEAPLHALAASIGWGSLGTVINIGILLSFFSCTLASINSSARIVFAMAHHGLIHDALGQSHESNKTPHVAVALIALLTFALPTLLYVNGVSAFNGQEYFATLCSFGFIVVYCLISLAAPFYLASIGKLTRRAVLYAAGGLAFMVLPLVGTIGIPGSEILPAPDEQGALFMAIFAAYMAVGLMWLVLQRMRQPKLDARMQHAVARMDLVRSDVRELEVVPATLESKVI